MHLMVEVVLNPYYKSKKKTVLKGAFFNDGYYYLSREASNV